MDAYKEAYLKLFNKTKDIMDELLRVSLECEAIIVRAPSCEDNVKEEKA